MEVRSLYQEPEVREELAWGALELNDVFKIYRSGPVETVALRGLDMRVEPRELVADAELFQHDRLLFDALARFVQLLAHLIEHAGHHADFIAAFNEHGSAVGVQRKWLAKQKPSRAGQPNQVLHRTGHAMDGLARHGFIPA